MNQQQIPDVAERNSVDTPATRLQGQWLLFVRVAWLLVVLVAISLNIIGLAAWYVQMQQVCMAAEEVCGLQQQLTPDGLQRLQQAGLSLDFYAAYRTLLVLGSLLVSWSVAAVIFWRKSNDWMALFVALFLVVSSDAPLGALARAYPSWWLLITCTNFLSGVVLILFYLFPNGGFVPGWTRWLALVWLLFGFVTAFFSGSRIDPNTWPDWLFGPLWMGLLLSFVGAQIYRYRRVSNLIERQQTKWVVFGFASAIVGFLSLVLIDLLFPAAIQPGSLATLIFETAVSLIILLIPLSFGMAILRSRLFDIDVIINRALVYGTLTALLALLYVASVVLLQELVRVLTGQGDQFAIVASTLTIAALFNPLRRRIQASIDRRFYRRKYDAQKTLAAFSVRLRDETDLEQLSDDLVQVVQETLQPAHVSLWLREPVKGGQR